MEKIKIAIPGKNLFATTFAISKEDINEANHMGNERILHHANLVRYDFFTSKGYVQAEKSHGLIIAHHTVQYKSEGFLYDDIVCEVGACNIRECSFDLVMHFVKKENLKTLAIVRSGLVYFDYENKKIRHLPKEICKLLNAAG